MMTGRAARDPARSYCSLLRSALTLSQAPPLDSGRGKSSNVVVAHNVDILDVLLEITGLPVRLVKPKVSSVT